MNESSKKVARKLLPQLVMFLVLAAGVSYQSGIRSGLVFAGVAILTHALWAPVYYAYLQRKARLEAARQKQLLKEFEADAPNRAARLAVAKAIAAYADANPAGGANA